MQSFNLDIRPEAIGPIKIITYSPGCNSTDWEPDVGDGATVHCHGINLVTCIKSAAKREYTAEIVAFEHYGNESFNGMRIGDTINFSFANVFGFSRA